MIGVTLPGGAGSGPAAAAEPGVIAQFVTGGVAVFIVAVAVLAHTGLVGHPDSFLDELAFGAFAAIFGVIPSLGARAQLAANTAAVSAAHARLDAAHVPPAADGVPGA